MLGKTLKITAFVTLLALFAAAQTIPAGTHTSASEPPRNSARAPQKSVTASRPRSLMPSSAMAKLSPSPALPLAARSPQPSPAEAYTPRVSSPSASPP